MPDRNVDQQVPSMAISADRSERIATDVEQLWATYRDGRSRPLQWRLDQLDGIAAFLRERCADVLAAVRKDLRKPEFEAYASDVGGVLSELRLVRRHLPAWSKPRRLSTPLRAQPATSWLYPEPWGAVLLLPAWNYPVGLVALPLVGAIAGGNTVAIKLPESAPASSAVVAKHLPNYVDTEAVQLHEGGPEVAQELLRHRFGLIHFTGSARVGRAVMHAAADYLTPVVLELGGKNPAYVHRSANIAIAARRIVMGRMFNAGQTCISPDYVLVDREVEGELIAAMQTYLRRAYDVDPEASPDLARIVNAPQFHRIVKLLDGDYETVAGGFHNESALYIAPTVVRAIAEDHPMMREEIFGPVLPVVAVDGPSAAIDSINSRSQALTMYVFGKESTVVERVISQTSAGSVVVNQMFTQAANPVLPFGGVGESGMGTYTGLATFDCFTHLKPVAKSPALPDLPLLYPPYSRWKQKLLRWVMR